MYNDLIYQDQQLAKFKIKKYTELNYLNNTDIEIENYNYYKYLPLCLLILIACIVYSINKNYINRGEDPLKIAADQLAIEMKRIEQVLAKLYSYASAGQTEKYLSDATIFLEMMSFIVIGWQWLKMGASVSLLEPELVCRMLQLDH